MDSLWQEWNEIKHQKENEHNTAEDEHLSETIRWYVEHRHEILNHHDQFMMETDLTKLGGMR